VRVIRVSSTLTDSNRYTRAKEGGGGMTEPWVSVDQVAAHLGVAKDTVYRWIESKSLPAQRVGRLWKFKLSDVDRWVMDGMAAEDAPAVAAKLTSEGE
jgi:excisionase family DNA binding protein